MTETVQIATEEFNEAPTTSGTIVGAVEHYAYTSKLVLDSASISVGKTTNASYYLKNPGTNRYIGIDAGKVKWSSSDTSVATVKNGIVTGVKSGTATITATMANGSYTASAEIFVLLPAPGKPTAIFADNGGITIQWAAVPGAVNYKVRYRTSDSPWTTLGTSKTTSYTWAGGYTGRTYYFTIQCVSADGKTETSDFDGSGRSFSYLRAPGVYGLAAGRGGIDIEWGEITGAAQYRLYYRVGTSGEFRKLVDTSSTTYTWEGAESGTTYSFTVCCLDSDGLAISPCNSYEHVIDYVAVPKLISVSAVASGVKITWEKVKGAARYRVYMRFGPKDHFLKLADTSETSYIWEGAQSGTSYGFSVGCLGSDDSIASTYDPDGLNITYVAAPKLTSVSPLASGVKIAWDEVNGAAKYRVYYRVGASGSFAKLADTSSTSYTWEGAESGTTYSFTVCCLDGAGKVCSAYDANGLSIAYVAVPKLTSISNTATGVKVAWEKVAGASRYRLYYRVGTSGAFKKLVNTSAGSYNWEGAESGKTYSFTARCLNSAGELCSSYDSKGLSIKYVAVPKLTSLTNTATGIKISWEKVAGASRYRVYYRTGSNVGFQKLINTSAASYTWEDAKGGTTYNFTVRALNSSNQVVSHYDAKGESITYVAAPKLTSVEKVSTGIKISWGKVKGASRYRVYYRVGTTGAFQKLINTSAGSYTWEGAKSGTTYNFTVRALDSSNQVISSYDSKGLVIAYK